MIDIETSPIVGYVWGTYQQNVLKIIEPTKIMSVAWKQLHDREVQVKTIADYRGYEPGVVEDKALVEEIWNVLDDADIVIGHHSDRFDIPKLNARFVWHGLKAPSKYATVDTKKVASRYFKFDSNSLNNLGQYLNLGKKVENGGFGLWVDCIAGDPRAWEKMAEYNVQDVALLEKVYLSLRPYIENHPSLTLFSKNPEEPVDCVCPTCLSKDVTRRGFSVTRTGRKQRYQCNDCGSWSSGPFMKAKIQLSSEDD